jgi:hypothetical protein
MHHTDIHPAIVDIIKQKRGGKLHIHDQPSRPCVSDQWWNCGVGLQHLYRRDL